MSNLDQGTFDTAIRTVSTNSWHAGARGLARSVCRNPAPRRNTLVTAILGALLCGTPMMAGAQTPPLSAGAGRESTLRKLGGHLGIGFGILTVSNIETTVIGNDFFTIGPVAGINIAIDDSWSFDFETIMVSQWLNTSSDRSRTTFLMDPGVVYNWGPISTGLRVAARVPQPSAEIGLIPIVLTTVPVGMLRYYAELDLPLFFYGNPPAQTGTALRTSLTVFLQTGVAF